MILFDGQVLLNAGDFCVASGCGIGGLFSFSKISHI